AKAPDDALIVHDAVLELGDMWIEIDAEGAAVWSADEIAEAGWKVVETARGSMLLKPDPRVIDMVAEHPVSRSTITALIVLHAKAGDRPEVFAEWTRPVGRPARGGVTERDVLYHRARYQAWHAALAVLVEVLRPLLAEYEATGPIAEVEPWLLA